MFIIETHMYIDTGNKLFRFNIRLIIIKLPCVL